MRAAALLPLAALAGCATIVPAPPAPSPQQLFFERLRALCGDAYEGRVVSNDAADREMAASRLVVEVRECSDREVRIAFHVGGDRSRVWVVTRTQAGLRLKHVHRHRDGSRGRAQPLWRRQQRAGQRRPAGFPRRRLLPRPLRAREDSGIDHQCLDAGDRVRAGALAYALRRPNRHFRVEFDLTRPIANPPPPWGERLGDCAEWSRMFALAMKELAGCPSRHDRLADS